VCFELYVELHLCVYATDCIVQYLGETELKQPLPSFPPKVDAVITSNEHMQRILLVFNDTNTNEIFVKRVPVI